MNFTSKYAPGDLVRLKTDKEKRDRMILNISFNPSLTPRYNLAHESNDSWHYEIEIEKVESNINTAGFKINNNHEKEKKETTV